MSSSFIRWRSSLYRFCSFFISGCRRCIACIERTCLKVSGRMTSRTVTVSSTIAQPQLTPTVSW
jgi:hypothetical protein